MRQTKEVLFKSWYINGRLLNLWISHSITIDSTLLFINGQLLFSICPILDYTRSKLCQSVVGLSGRKQHRKTQGEFSTGVECGHLENAILLQLVTIQRIRTWSLGRFYGS